MDDAVHVEVESVELGHDVRELFDGLLIVIDLCVSYAHHLCEQLQMNTNELSLNRSLTLVFILASRLCVEALCSLSSSSFLLDGGNPCLCCVSSFGGQWIG